MPEGTESRKVTRSTIDMMLAKGDELELGEPVGVVILWPGEMSYMKAIWKNDANREHTQQSLLAASIDELRKSGG